MLGWCCPCVLSWKIAKSLGENPLLYCLGSFILPITPLMRQRTREKFGMTVSIMKCYLMFQIISSHHHSPTCKKMYACMLPFAMHSLYAKWKTRLTLGPKQKRHRFKNVIFKITDWSEIKLAFEIASNLSKLFYWLLQLLLFFRIQRKVVRKKSHNLSKNKTTCCV